MATIDKSVLMFIQGRVKPYASSAYQAYVEATAGLMRKYQGEIVTRGGGIDSRFTTAEWPVNAVVRFPDLKAAEGYLSDPLLRKVNDKYQDITYDELQISLVAPTSDSPPGTTRLG